MIEADEPTEATLAEAVVAADELWDQLARVNPVTFIAMGDNDVVVTRNEAFAAKLRSAG